MTTINGTPAGDLPADASLSAIKQNLLNRIAEVTSKPKPNYNIDGQQVSWQSYLDSLFKKLDLIDKQINAAEPFEVVSRGIT